MLTNTERAAGQAADIFPQIARGVHKYVIAETGFPFAQLLMLFQIGRGQEKTATALAREMRVSLPTATGLIDRLERGGFVTRQASSQDRRQKIIKVTPEGERLVGEFTRAFEKRWCHILGFLSERDQLAFLDVLGKLAAAVAAADEAEVAGSDR